MVVANAENASSFLVLINIVLEIGYFCELFRYDSRWILVVQEYNYIRGRLFNSNLTESTDLTLFNISETSLRIWHKNQTRHEDILTLMQGITPPGKRSIAKEKLPTPTTPTSLQGEASFIKFKEPEDRTGVAVLKFGQTRARRVSASNNSPSADLDEPGVVCPMVSDIPLRQPLDTAVYTSPSPSTPPSQPITPRTQVLSPVCESNSVPHTAVVVNPPLQDTEPKKPRKRKILSKTTQLFPQQPAPSFYPHRSPYQPIPPYHAIPPYQSVPPPFRSFLLINQALDSNRLCICLIPPTLLCLHQ